MNSEIESSNEKRLLDEITDLELASLECPTYESQEKKWQTIIDSLTHAKIDRLVRESTQQSCYLANYEFYRQTNGVINKIFILNVTNVMKDENQSDQVKEKQLILRISNPHTFWKGKRTQNEVAVMTYLKTKAKQQYSKLIPLILSYSYDEKTSLLGCEYILMEKCPGVILSSLIDSFKEEESFFCLEKIIKQLLEFLNEMKHLSLNFTAINLMGCFKYDMSIEYLLQDGPTLTSSASYLEYLTKHFTWNVKEIKKLKKYANLAEQLDAIRLELEQVCHQNQNVLNNLDFNDELTLIHGDLNSSNILIDAVSLEVTAILDWEFSSLGYDDSGLDFFASWFEDVVMKEKVKKYLSDIMIQNENKSLAKRVRIHFQKLNAEASQLSFHVSSWFYEAKERGDTDLEVRRYIERQANLVVDLMKETPIYLNMLRNFI